MLGFSAGGNLLGHAVWDRAPRTYNQDGRFDDPGQPDFGVMIYGGGFIEKNETEKFRGELKVPADAPPMFFSVSHDDNRNPVEATRLYLEYLKNGIPAELHVFTHGGHGYGMRRDAKVPAHAWPQRCADWMRAMGWLPTP